MLTNIGPTPNNSILGINYSGMHDTSFSIVDEFGKIVFASSLERYSRVKQDGRYLVDKILTELPWDKISKIAISTDRNFHVLDSYESSVLKYRLSDRDWNPSNFEHNKRFYELIKSLPIEPEFVCHQLSHAASSIRSSGFSNTRCITYDGGMANCHKFGGIFSLDSSVSHEINEIEYFSTEHYPRLTYIYTFITAMLGFTPNKHEGKVTGLSARGKFNAEIYEMIGKLFFDDYRKIEDALVWINDHEREKIPQLVERNSVLEEYRILFKKFQRSDIAFALQLFIEIEFKKLLKNVDQFYGKSENICFAGGLFSNVKLNMDISKLNFNNIFIAPFMTDEGAGLGAALSLVDWSKSQKPVKIKNLYLGHSDSTNKIEDILIEKEIAYSKSVDYSKTIAEHLANKKNVCIFNERSIWSKGFRQ